MIGIILSIGFIIFGVFLKTTKNPGFQSSKKFAWIFVILGLITLLGKLTLLYLQK